METFKTTNNKRSSMQSKFLQSQGYYYMEHTSLSCGISISQGSDCQATSCKETVSVAAEKSKEQEAETSYTATADTFTQEKKHELQVLMAEDQPDIVARTEVNPKGRSYKIEDIKIRGYKETRHILG